MALHSVQNVIRPTTPEAAWREKADRGDAARFLGGGIDVVLYAPPTVDTLIDLSGLNLDGVAADGGGLRIGAGVTMTKLLETPASVEYLGGFLAEAVREVASPLQRNLATIGGTLAVAHPWSDVIPALLSLDAEAVLFDGSERRMSLEAYYEGREAGELGQPLILGVRLPEPPTSARGAFVSFTRTAFDVAILNVAVVVAIDGGTWRDVRISVGGRPGLAKRIRAVEQQLVGSPVAEDGIADAAKGTASDIDAKDDRRATADYRKDVAHATVGRCLRKVAGLAARSAS